ncbi:hypothetical protein BCF59_0599 [Mycoplasmopsis mustelae]|uniref:Lipoprotein n=1 Tax=Mycoplasmopsis mustelae TaxID=171289 RepID=A0A4R7UE43_9BACT|nr:hypothetical protein [Mycoplasmopsis mustelae]TDV23254.1 hypothetical protein BCF59_0599 [Mycoplasmopsis mustelae]
MKKKHLSWLIPFLSIPMLSLASCVSIIDNENNKKDEEYNDEKYAENFYDLLGKAQKESQISTPDDDFFEVIFWAYNFSFQARESGEKVFINNVDKNYVLIKNTQELQEKILNKLNTDFFKGVNIETTDKENEYKKAEELNDTQLKEFINRKFSKIFLNNEPIEMFFKKKNLFIFQSIITGDSLSSLHIVPSTEQNVYNLVRPSAILNYHRAFPTVRRPITFSLYYKVFDKSIDNVEIKQRLNKKQAIQLYKNLLSKYKHDD